MDPILLVKQVLQLYIAAIELVDIIFSVLENMLSILLYNCQIYGVGIITIVRITYCCLVSLHTVYSIKAYCRKKPNKCKLALYNYYFQFGSHLK